MSKLFKVLVNKNGFMERAPIFESHHRSENRMEIIVPHVKDNVILKTTYVKCADPDERGCYNLAPILDHLVVGTPVRFVADYFTGTRDCIEHRWYGVLEKVEEFAKDDPNHNGAVCRLIFRKYETSHKAVLAAQAVLV